MRPLSRRRYDQTADTNPEKLTGDWHDRETGKALDAEQLRGEMPGAAQNATKVDQKGPF